MQCMTLLCWLTCRGHCGSALGLSSRRQHDWAGSAFQMDTSFLSTSLCTDVSAELFALTTGNCKEQKVNWRKKPAYFGVVFKVSDVTVLLAQRELLLVGAGDVQMWHVCSRMHKTGGEFFYLLEMLRESSSPLTDWSAGERRGLSKSTPDCWLCLRTMPWQCALHDRQQAIHWSSQCPTLNASSFTPLLPPRQRFTSSLPVQFLSVSRPLNTVNLSRNKQMRVVYTESLGKVCTLAEILMSCWVTGLQWQGFL